MIASHLSKTDLLAHLPRADLLINVCAAPVKTGDIQVL